MIYWLKHAIVINTIHTLIQAVDIYTALHNTRSTWHLKYIHDLGAVWTVVVLLFVDSVLSYKSQFVPEEVRTYRVLTRTE